MTRSTSSTSSRRWKGLDRIFAPAGVGVPEARATAANLHGRVELGTTTGQFDPVNAWHHDVGQQQVEHFALERGERRLAILEVLDIVPGPLQGRSQEGAHHFIVFSQQNFAHNPRSPDIATSHDSTEHASGKLRVNITAELDLYPK